MLFRANKKGTILDWSDLDCHRPALETEQEVTEFVIKYWFPEMEIFA